MNPSKRMQKEAALVATVAVTIGELVFIALTPQGGSLTSILVVFLAIAVSSAVVGVLWFFMRSKFSKPGTRRTLEEIIVGARGWLLSFGIAASVGALVIGFISRFYPLTVAAGLLLAAFVVYAALRLRLPS